MVEAYIVFLIMVVFSSGILLGVFGFCDYLGNENYGRRKNSSEYYDLANEEYRQIK